MVMHSNEFIKLIREPLKVQPGTTRVVIVAEINQPLAEINQPLMVYAAQMVGVDSQGPLLDAIRAAVEEDPGVAQTVQDAVVSPLTGEVSVTPLPPPVAVVPQQEQVAQTPIPTPPTPSVSGNSPKTIQLICPRCGKTWREKKPEWSPTPKDTMFKCLCGKSFIF